MHILIVDDHPLTCAGLVSLFASVHEGASLHSAHTAQEARTHLLSGTAIDWLFLDIRLPDDPEGLLFEWICETAWVAKTILVSAQIEPDFLKKALAAGVRGFIPKSADPDMVLQGFDAIRQGRIYLPPTISLPPASATDSRKPLSPRQQEVLGYLLQGSANKVIAQELDLTLNTVKEYASTIFRVYGVSNRLELILKFGARRSQPEQR